MNLGVTTVRPRYGHLMVMFGLFLSLITLTLQGVNAPKTIAFGTSEVADLSNQYRINAGLSPLVLSGLLSSSAQAKANDMASKSYFAHNSPEGATPWTFFDSVGYSYTTAGENLALTNQSASSVADGWYNSPGHRANLLSSAYTEVGYGIAFVPVFTYNGTTYSDVYLVAAHYALPVVSASPVAQATTTPPASTEPSTAPEVVEQPVQEAPITEQTDEQKALAVEEHPKIAGNTDAVNGTTTSGTLAVARTEQPKLSIKLAYVGLGLGAILVVVGSAIEIRRFLKHLPLVPHLH